MTFQHKLDYKLSEAIHTYALRTGIGLVNSFLDVNKCITILTYFNAFSIYMYCNYIGCETTIKELEAKILLTVACMLFVLRFPKHN